MACPADATHDLGDGHVNDSQRASRERPVRSLDLFKLLEPCFHETYLGPLRGRKASSARRTSCATSRIDLRRLRLRR